MNTAPHTPKSGPDAEELFRERFRVFLEDVADGFYEIDLEQLLEISASLIVDRFGKRIGFQGVAGDVTARKRAEQINQVLYRIARALYQFPRLERMLEYITRQVQELIRAAGAMVILIDEKKQEFYIPVASYEDSETGSKMTEIRFPVDKGVAGHVYHTGKPLIVPDTSKSPYFYEQVDKEVQYHHKNMLDVPLRVQDRMIGVLCAVNKKEGVFDDADVDLLSAVANLVGMPIENARINEALQRSYENVRGLNRAKEQVIHHLSHELKTPLSVLSASLGLLEKRSAGKPDEKQRRIMDRARRNLQRLLDMQYEIADMLREKDYRAHGLFTFLLDAGSDLLAALAEAEADNPKLSEKIQSIINREFGLPELPGTWIELDRFVKRQLDLIKPRFMHRRIRLEMLLEPVAPVYLPVDVMQKIVEGLVRNAVENTPDHGRVAVVVRSGEQGTVFEVKDYGVGITDQKQQLIFNHYFAVGDAMNYATRKPYDFNAGGRGFDLLRMAIFSERYGFATRMISRRCRHIPTDGDPCPGVILTCAHCREPADCEASGATTMQVRFQPSAGIRSPGTESRTDEKPADAASEERFFQDMDVEFLIHELKDPVAVIETAVRMLLEKQNRYGELTPRQVKTLNRALRNSRKARSLLADLLEVGRSDAGCFQCTWFDAAATVDAVLMETLEFVDADMGEKLQHLDSPEQRQEVLAESGIRVDCSPAGRQARLCQDETKFRQILGNLVKNAFQHRREQVAIDVDCKEAVLTVEVRDDGPGVAKGTRESIFERYKQMNTCAPLSRAGHGLGLAGARVLARRLGGDIAIKTDRGPGATFCLTLPLKFESPGK
jgi:signal transduction histidine kinase